MNKDTDKTKEQLLAELKELRDRSKKGEEALKESEDRFTTVANASPDGIGISDLNGIIEFVAPQTIAMWGYSKDEFIGKHIHEVIHERSHGTVDHVIDELLKGNNLGALEYEMVRKDGTIFICEANCSLLYDKNNNPEKVLYIQRDITERKQAEELLRESDLRLKTLINATPDFICFKDGKGRWLIANDADLELFALKNVDYFGKTDADLAEFTDQIYKQAFLLCMESDEKSWQSKVLSRGEEVIPTIEGTNKTFDVIKVPLFESDGARKGLVVLGRDITALKQAEKELTKLSSAVQQSPSATAITDTKGNLVYVNPKFTELTGYSLEEAMGLNPRVLKSGELDDDIYKELWRTISSGNIWRGEFHNKSKNGELFWEMASISPIFDEQGKIINYVKVAEDITQRRQAEEELAAEKERLAVTLRSIGDGVITTDIEGKIVFINKVAEDLTGWSHEEARGKRAHEVFTIVNEKTGQKCASPVSRVLELGRIVGLANHTALITRNGAQVSIADSGAPIRDAESKIVGVVIVFRDVTHERRIEEELLKTRKLESVGVLAGGIAHDFNNILAAISGNIELASFRVEDDKVTSLLSSAQKATMRAAKLTQQLLTFSKGGDPVKEKTSLIGLIQESADFVLHGSNVRCEYSCPDDLWMVDADSGQLGQVIQNIIINAMQAMPEGGKIHINCSNIENAAAESLLSIHDESFVCIRIQDTGIGIPREIIDKIFDPYYTTKQQGSGLGLSICHSIINKHDGHISVQSSPGKGTAFTIYLPAVPPGETTAVTVPHTGSALRAARILVMDDEEIIRNLVKAQLTALGHEAVLVAGGEQAINEYQKLQDSGMPVDLVIMDLTVPGGMGGQEAAKKLLQVDPQAKIIVASGYSNDPVMADYREYGFCAAVAKPFDLAELRKGIESALS